MKRSETICARCNVNPRDPYSKNCTPCRDEIKAGHQEKHLANQKRKRVARKTTIPCICGCGKPTVYPTRYATEECKAKGKAAALARNAAQKKEARSKKLEPAAKPLTPAQIEAKEKEQARLDAEASARDRAWHAQFMKNTLGLESAPNQPLSTKVVRPPPEVFRQIEAAYRPMTEQEKEFHLPLRADISYY